jgi:hypothetical protein
MEPHKKPNLLLIGFHLFLVSSTVCSSDTSVLTYQFGSFGDLPVIGDWTGDGITEIGNYKGNGVFALDYNGNGQWDGASLDRAYIFRSAPSIPVTGDWNGDGITEIGNYKGDGIWALDYNGNGVWDGSSIDRVFSFGSSTDKPIVGDWNGDGISEVGNYKGNGTWAFDYNGNGAWDDRSIDLVYTTPWSMNDLPVVGDWNGDNTSELGVFRPADSVFYLFQEPTRAVCFPYSVEGCRACNEHGSAWVYENSHCAGDKICQDGDCIDRCQNECSTEGSKRCSDDGFQICGFFDGDSCLEYSAVKQCPEDQACANGVCGSTCADNLYGEFARDIPDGDFYQNIGIEKSIQRPPLYTDPLESNQTGWAADSINYFDYWGCSSDAGIRFVRKLGIAPLGTHHPNWWKDSLMLSYDEWSGGFPVVYFTQGLMGADKRPLDNISSIYPSVFAMKKAYYNSDYKKWFITDVLNQPNTGMGVSSQDGWKDDYIMNDYAIGLGTDDYFPGWGPTANKPGNQSKIPGVSYTSKGFGIGSYPLYGNGVLGLTTIIHSTQGSCIHMNPTMFDFDVNGIPRSFTAYLFYPDGRTVTSGCFLPDGTELKAGSYVYRYNDTSMGWQIDLTSGNFTVINYAFGTNAKFLQSDWMDGTSIYDLNTRTSTNVLNCWDSNPLKQIYSAESSGTEKYFIYVSGGEAPWIGTAVGLYPSVVVHDIYIASMTDLNPKNINGTEVFILPDVVKVYRDVLGRDPTYAEGFDWTGSLMQEEMNATLFKQYVANSSEATEKIKDLYQEIIGRDPTQEESTNWSAHLAAENSSLTEIIRNLAVKKCSAITSTTSSTTTTTSTTTQPTCVMPGNYPDENGSCGEVTLVEVVNAINQWSLDELELGNIIDLINSWADPVSHPPV